MASRSTACDDELQVLSKKSAAQIRRMEQRALLCGCVAVAAGVFPKKQKCAKIF